MSSVARERWSSLYLKSDTGPGKPCAPPPSTKLPQMPELLPKETMLQPVRCHFDALSAFAGAGSEASLAHMAARSRQLSSQAATGQLPALRTVRESGTSSGAETRPSRSGSSGAEAGACGDVTPRYLPGHPMRSAPAAAGPLSASRAALASLPAGAAPLVGDRRRPALRCSSLSCCTAAPRRSCGPSRASRSRSSALPHRTAPLPLPLPPLV